MTAHLIAGKNWERNCTLLDHAHQSASSTHSLPSNSMLAIMPHNPITSPNPHLRSHEALGEHLEKIIPIFLCLILQFTMQYRIASTSLQHGSSLPKKHPGDFQAFQQQYLCSVIKGSHISNTESRKEQIPAFAESNFCRSYIGIAKEKAHTFASLSC